MLRQPAPGERFARKAFKGHVLISCDGAMWQTQFRDISASGALLEKPDSADLQSGDSVHLEIVPDSGQTIALVGKLVRVTDATLAIQFRAIPDDSEAPLWQLLGEHAEGSELPEY